jgi:hypothetical protein
MCREIALDESFFWFHLNSPFSAKAHGVRPPNCRRATCVKAESDHLTIGNGDISAVR